MGFIAEESKLLLSDSQSVASDGLSISNISAILGTPHIHSPYLPYKLEEEFSGLEEWSVEVNTQRIKRNFKRPNPAIEEEVSDEEYENRCSKKKMGERMKVLTINSQIKNVFKGRPNGYQLRSRTKGIVESESSSNEELR